MSEFDDFFERERENSLVSKFHFRNPISFHRVPLYLRILRWKIYPRNPVWVSLFKFLASDEFLAFENRIFSKKAIKAVSGSVTRYFSPRVAYENFRTLDRSVMNYRNGNEPELAHLIDFLIPDNGTFVDVGANWGYFSFYLYLREKFKGTIHSFEPLPQSYAAMSDLKENMNVDDRLKTYNLALSDKDSTAQFHFSAFSTQSSALLRSPIRKENFERDNVLEVQTRVLDSFVFDKMDFLKVDVEGFENECLLGAESHIKKFQPYVFFESHYSQESREQSLQTFYFLEKLEYRFFLPAWVQNKHSFFVGIGWDFEMNDFSLTPFKPEDRPTFGIDILNVFACHKDKAGNLGIPFHQYFEQQAKAA